MPDKSAIEQRIEAALTQSSALSPALVHLLQACQTEILAMTQQMNKLEQYHTMFDVYQLAIEGSHDGLVDWHVETGVVRFSARWANALGYDLSEMPTDLSVIETWLHPDDLDRAMNDWRQFKLSSKVIFQTHYRMRHKLGSYVWFSLRVMALRNVHGKIKRIIATHTDITDFTHQQYLKRDQSQLIETLYETLRILTATMDEDSIFDLLLIQSSKVIPHNAASITLISKDSARIVAYYIPSFDPGVHRLVGSPLIDPASSVVYGQMMMSKQPYLVHCAVDNDLIHDVMPPQVTQVMQHYVYESYSYLGAPIVLEEETIAFLNIVRWQLHDLNQEHVERLHSFANQAILAIYRARLYQQAGEVASLRERQRIASDLHDAVSQTLFSANMLSEILPNVWEQDSALGRTYLKELNVLTRNAINEMRSLMVELRPEALVQPDLSTLLQQLIETFRNRVPFALQITILGEAYPLPEDVQITFYRVAQESINNSLKHARAQQVLVTLQWSRLQLALLVVDDGIGFDVHTVGYDRMGLQIMRERAQAINAYLNISSVLNQGTRIHLAWRA